MTTQPTLFGTYDTPTASMCCPHCQGTGRISALEPGARATDPDTSHRARAAHRDTSRFSLASRQGRVLSLLSAVDLTAQECAIRIHGNGAPISVIEGTRRAVSSLYRLALVAPSTEERINPGSATPSIVWTVTSAGKQTLSRLLETGWSK